MYTQKEFETINGEIRLRFIIFLIPALVILAGQVYGIVNRNELLTAALGILLCFFSIFFFGTQLLPRMNYRTHVNNMIHGRVHTVDGTFLSFDREESVVSGVSYRAMHVECVDEKGKPYERLFYWDLEKDLPDYTEGTPLQITYHDREIADCVKI